MDKNNTAYPSDKFADIELAQSIKKILHPKGYEVVYPESEDELGNPKIAAIMALVETDRIKMQTDIEYAIGYCQGLGNPCKYLESRYGTPKPPTNGSLNHGEK